MSDGKLFVFCLAMIAIPIILMMLIKIANTIRCSSRRVQVNGQRQNTHHVELNNKDHESCKERHTTKDEKPLDINTLPPHSTAREAQSPIKNLETTQRQAQLNPLPSEKALLELKHINSELTKNAFISTTTATPNALYAKKKLHLLDSTNIGISEDKLGESISISEALEDIKLNNCLWLDTETTGLSNTDQIIEISICTYDKKVVFNSILNSKVKCSEQARAIHHITDEQIADGMPIQSAKAILLTLLEGKTIISFNADFDCRMLYQTFGFIDIKRFCVMKWSKSVLDYEKWPRLEKVCAQLNIKQTETHRSLVDTMTTIELFNKLLDLTSNHKSLLRDFASIDLNAIDKLEDGETLFLSPNGNVFNFDCLIDRYGNDIIKIRSNALKRMLTKEGTRIFAKKNKKGKTLKTQYMDQIDFQLPISTSELKNRLHELKLKHTKPNKYLSLRATLTPSDVIKATKNTIDGTYYFPSIAINPQIYDVLENLPIFYNNSRKSVAFTIINPKNTLKKMFALGLQGYSSIITAVEQNDTISITAYHLLDAQQISILRSWEIDGEKSWSGDY
ncbi:3'-5' exonuclease [Aeromonas caviae]|uniref:3'-5' exonuclease n=1 Tax=Aeromonas caviae TaxID=648 RepID=UPI00191FF97F|nr:3'-5' exonuclease [Aeromonas caviae]MBL0550690.1 3'-5' exonuclease [Aeromonas caviae]